MTMCVVYLISYVYLQRNSPTFGFVHFIGEEAVEKALKVNNSDYNENFGPGLT